MFALIYIICFWFILDIFHIYRYKICKRDYKEMWFCRKFCKNWMCKKASTCFYSRVNWKKKQSEDFVFYYPDYYSQNNK